MPRGTSWAISTPALRAATASARRGSRWNLSTRSGDGRQATAAAAAAAAAAAVQGAQPKMPRLTNRLRRLARAYPEAVAAISPAAVEESRAKYSAGVPRSEVSNISRQLSCNESWLSMSLLSNRQVVAIRGRHGSKQLAMLMPLPVIFAYTCWLLCPRRRRAAELSRW